MTARVSTSVVDERNGWQPDAGKPTPGGALTTRGRLHLFAYCKAICTFDFAGLPPGRRAARLDAAPAQRHLD